MIVESIIEGYIGRPKDHVSQDLSGKRPSGVPLAEDIDTLLHPDDVPLPQQSSDLVAGALILPENVQEDLIVKFLPRYPFS
jgi:hypothetical protein